MASTLHYVAVILGVVFMIAGLTKVAPIQPIHNEQVSAFGRFVRVFPLKSFGINPAADMYRAVVAFIEIAMGALLAFGRYDYRRFSAVGLFIVMCGAVYTHLALKDEIQDCIPSLVMGGVLLLLLIHRNGFYGGHAHID